MGSSALLRTSVHDGKRHASIYREITVVSYVNSSNKSLGKVYIV